MRQTLSIFTYFSWDVIQFRYIGVQQNNVQSTTSQFFSESFTNAFCGSSDHWNITQKLYKVIKNSVLK